MAKRTMPKQQPGRSVQSVGTPLEFLIAAARKLGIGEFAFDLAADVHNAICPEFYDESDDALASGVSWVFDGIAWLNPPFGRIGPWVAKAREESDNGGTIAILIPASIGARWWIDHVVGQCQIVPLDGRITFVGQTDPYPKDCALLLYGPEVKCGYAPAWRWMDDLTEEERDMAKRRIGRPKKFKAKTPAGKKAEKIAAARAGKTPKVRLIRKGKGSVVDVATDGKEPARVTTFRPNGSTSQAMPPLSEFDPGKIVLPSPEDAVRVLGELASLNDQAAKAKSRYEELKDYTKTAKEKYDGLMEQVGVRLRQATHASDLPLFADVEQREQDQAVMEAGPVPASEGSADEPAGAPASEPELEATSIPSDVPAAPTPASEPTAEELLLDEQIPF